MLGVFRATPSACALAFGVPRYLASCQRDVRSWRQSTAASLDNTGRRDRSFQTREVTTSRSRCLWAAVTTAAASKAAPQVDNATAVDPVDGVEEFESQLDAMVVEEDDDAPAPSEKPPSPRRQRYIK